MTNSKGPLHSRTWRACFSRQSAWTGMCRSRFTLGSQSLTSTLAEHPSPKDVLCRHQLPRLTSAWKATARSSARVVGFRKAGSRGRRRREKLILCGHYIPQLHPFPFQPLYCCDACIRFHVQQFQPTTDLDSPPCHFVSTPRFCFYLTWFCM